MQVGDSKKCLRNETCFLSANTSKTLTPVTFLLKIFCLNYNMQQENRSSLCSYCRMFFMAIIFGLMSVYVLYYKLTYMVSELNFSVMITDFIQNVYDYFQYLVDLFYVHRFGRRYYYEYFMQYKAIDQIIGTGSCATIRKRLVKLVTSFLIIWLTTTTLDFTAWALNYEWIVPAAFSSAYLYFFIKILNNLDMTSQTMHIEVRLRIIGDLLQNCYSSTESQPGVTCDSLENNNWFYANAKLRTNERMALKSCATNNCHEIRWLSRCYLLLTEQCDFINKMFGIRVLMNCLSLLIDMVRFTNLVVRILTGSQNVLQSSGWSFFPVISTTSRLLTCMLILISLVSHCQRVYQQSDRIISITDHLLLNKKPDSEMRAAVIELRELVQQRPISFHLANFLRLDYSMLLSTASVVVTYTIILLQSIK